MAARHHALFLERSGAESVGIEVNFLSESVSYPGTEQAATINIESDMCGGIFAIIDDATRIYGRRLSC